MDMGVEPYLLASALNGAVAQRLVRKNCPHCVTSYYPPETALVDAGRAGEVRQIYRRGEGCAKCNHTGFAGRTAVVETMLVDDELRELIHNAAGEEVIRRHLRQRDWEDLRQNGLRLADRGISPLEEVLRVTHVESAVRVRAETERASAVGRRGASEA
jgi:general secretion pathway protein E